MADTPAYRRIADTIAAGIRAGTYPPGAMLPSEAALAEEYGVTRPTVRQGLAELRATGVIRVENGRGAFVADPARLQQERPDVVALRRERDTAWEMARREAAAVRRVLDLADQLDADGHRDVAARIRRAVEPE
jgi:DNA-binding GntR family transcriptional regulator